MAEGIRKVAEALLEEKEKEEEYLLLKQGFEKAYFASDNEAILRAYDTIQRSSHRESFNFSPSALQQIDLALRMKQIALQTQALPQKKRSEEPKVGLRLRLTAADKTDVGKQAEQNEDSAYRRVESSEEGDRGLFIIADGEKPSGEVASKLATETISRALDSFFKPLPDQPVIKLKFASEDLSATQKTHKVTETAVVTNVEEQLIAAIQQASRAILHLDEQQATTYGPASTVTAALIQNDQAYIANVGNSRVYLLRNKQLSLLTRDHSQAARLVESKQIEPEDIYIHPQRHLLYRLLGAGQKIVEIDIFHETLQAGDTFYFVLMDCGKW